MPTIILLLICAVEIGKFGFTPVPTLIGSAIGYAIACFLLGKWR